MIQLLIITLSFTQLVHSKGFEKADQLFLQKKRGEALLILAQQKEIQHRSQKALNQRKKKYSEFFYTEKAHKDYESANSFFGKDFNRALELYKEALRLEPLNLSVLQKIWYIEFRNEKCSSKIIQDVFLHEKYFDFHEAYRVFKHHSWLCQKKPADVLMEGATNTPEGELIQARAAIEAQKYVLAETILEKLRKKEPHYPEVDFWQNKLNRLKGVAIQGLPLKEHYKNLCQNEVNRIKEYPLDPQVCLHEKDFVMIQGEK